MAARHYRLFSSLTHAQYKKSKHFYVTANKSYRTSARTCIFLHSKHTDSIKRHSFLMAYPFIFMSSFHVRTLYKPQQITPLRFKPRCKCREGTLCNSRAPVCHQLSTHFSNLSHFSTDNFCSIHSFTSGSTETRCSTDSSKSVTFFDVTATCFRQVNILKPLLAQTNY
jgi:hypothetical protein